MNSSLAMYILHDSTRRFVTWISSSIMLRTSLASKIQAAAFPIFAKRRCWYRNNLFDKLSRSHICSNRSACEHEFADLLWVISEIMASIPASTTAALVRKKDLRAGLIPSIVSCCETLFSTFDKTCKLDLSNASTVWLLHKR